MVFDWLCYLKKKMKMNLPDSKDFMESFWGYVMRQKDSEQII